MLEALTEPLRVEQPLIDVFDLEDAPVDDNVHDVDDNGKLAQEQPKVTRPSDIGPKE